MSIFIQGSPEWLEFRKTHIGGSDAPVIMGVSPWMTPLQLWEHKLGFTEIECTPWMRKGLDQEESARKKFEDLTGNIVFPQVMLHDSIPWMMASLDGIDIEQKCIVEIKCPGKDDHATAARGKIPDKYFPQLQHQLEVCKLDSAFYFSYNEENSYLVTVKRDESYIQKMLEKEREFWERLQELRAPEFTERDYRRRDDEGWLETAARWKENNEKLEDLKVTDELLRKELIAMANTFNSTGGGVRVTKSVRKGHVDYNEIPELKQIDLERYRKSSSEAWRISKQ